MAYYPNSQIKSNLFTNGGEYSLSTDKTEYKGYYYELSNGKKYTGNSPNDKPNILLISFTPRNEAPEFFNPSPQIISINNVIGRDTTQNFPFNTLYKPNDISYPIIRNLPIHNPTTPTQKDYDLGIFQRYFCKKNNELKYIEIDKTTFQQLKSEFPQIAWDLYSAISLNWYLTGDKTKVYNTNKNLSTLIETQEKWHGFSQYFKDQFSKYYLES
jgi:hypothetical protein